MCITFVEKESCKIELKIKINKKSEITANYR